MVQITYSSPGIGRITRPRTSKSTGRIICPGRVNASSVLRGILLLLMALVFSTASQARVAAEVPWGQPAGEAQDIPTSIKRQGKSRIRVPHVPDIHYTDECQAEDQALLFRERAFPDFPRSEWQETNRSLYTEILAAQPADILVVPFTPQSRPLDLIERSLLTRTLVAKLEARGFTVTDPDIAEAALLESGRVVNRREVYHMAERLNVQAVVFGRAGYRMDEAGQRRLCMEIEVRTGSADHIRRQSTPWLWRDDQTVFSHEQLPHMTGAESMNEVVEYLAQAVPRHRIGQAPTLVAGSIPALRQPDSWFEAGHEGVLNQAFGLQLVGALSAFQRADTAATRERERLFERSLIMALTLPETHPARPLLMARAYLELYRRPAAQAILEAVDPTALEEPYRGALAALKAFSLGNLTKDWTRGEALTHPVLSLLAALDWYQLSYMYGEDWEFERDNYAESKGVWSQWIGRVLSQVDDWDVRSNVPLKRLLDEHFPVPGMSLPDLLTRLEQQGEPAMDNRALEQSVEEHFRRYVGNHAVALSWSENPSIAGQSGLRDLDMLEWTRGWATNSILKRIDKKAWALGHTEKAMELIREYRPLFGDHPEMQAMESGVNWEHSEKESGAVSEKLYKSLYSHGLRALFWAGGQDNNSSSVIYQLGTLKESESDVFRVDGRYVISPYRLAQLNTLYLHDFPRRWDWPVKDIKRSYAVQVRDAKDALNYRTSEYYGVGDFYELLDDRDPATHDVGPDWVFPDEFIDSLANRFIGSPGRSLIMAEHYLNEGRGDAARELYEQRLALPSKNWEIRRDYARLLLHLRDWDKAIEVLENFPGYQPEAKVSSLSLLSHVLDSAQLLMKHGLVQEGLEFNLRRSKEYRPGSAMQMTNDYRLAMISAQPRKALKVIRRMARRYPGNVSNRFLITALALNGLFEEADALFRGNQDLNDSAIWFARLVRDRLDPDKPEDEFEALKERYLSTDWKINHSAFIKYVFRSLTLDRMPDERLSQLLDMLRPPEAYHITDNGWLINESNRVVGPSSYFNHPTENPQKTRIPERSELALFVDAYVSLKRKHYEHAYERFAEHGQYFHLIRGWEGGYGMAYLAWAAGQSGQGAALKAHLQEVWFPTMGRTVLQDQHETKFDMHLSFAALAVAEGQHDLAMEQLYQARISMPDKDNSRPIPPVYQFMELNEWFYEASGDERYKDLLISVARMQQFREPAMSWVWSFVAKYGQGEEQRRALGYAVWLDDRSERLAGIPDAEKDSARAELEEKMGYSPLNRLKEEAEKLIETLEILVPWMPWRTI